VNYSAGVSFDQWVQTADANGTIFSDGGGVAGERGVGLFVEGGKLVARGSDGSGAGNFLIIGPTVNDDTFHHVAVTWTGNPTANGVKLYLDGVLVGQATATAAITTGSRTLQYGGQHDLPALPKLAGQIDEMHVFNRALSASEVAAISRAGSRGITLGNLASGVAIQSRAN